MVLRGVAVRFGVNFAFCVAQFVVDYIARTRLSERRFDWLTNQNVNDVGIAYNRSGSTSAYAKLPTGSGIISPVRFVSNRDDRCDRLRLCPRIAARINL